MPKLLNRLLVSIALTGLASSALAAPYAVKNAKSIDNRQGVFNYTYIEGNVNVHNLINSDSVDNAYGNMYGLGVKGSYGILPNLSIRGQLAYSLGDTDLLEFNTEAVFHMPLGIGNITDTDILAHAGLEYQKYDVDYSWYDYSDDDIGVILGAGIRTKLTKKLEFFADVSLHTAFDNNFVGTAGAIYTVIDNLEVGGQISTELNTVSAIVRYNF